MVVGVVIFLILVAINFIVITKGAGRVAEVAARFTLDAMPGRQMSIDGDLSAGLIDEAEAKQRREEVSREADFYGAMDGAAKFVRGDAIAGLLITAINILGGLFVGMVQRGMPLGRAVSEYTLLTVGDGLVTPDPGAGHLHGGRHHGHLFVRGRPGGRGGSAPDRSPLPSRRGSPRGSWRVWPSCRACRPFPSWRWPEAWPSWPA